MQKNFCVNKGCAGLRRGTVTKLPDTKPLKLVGCYILGQKKALVRQFGARGDSTLFGHLVICNVTEIVQHLSWLINGDIQLLAC